MQKSRLEAFSDGVLAIIITILVLELKVPHEVTLEALIHIWPIYAAYLISFVNIFMMWLNHHNIFASIETINHRINWANGFFLLTVSNIPFVTGLAGQTRWESPLPVALYGAVMVLVSISFVWLRQTAATNGDNTQASQSYHRREFKVGIVVIVGYSTAIFFALFYPMVSLAIYLMVPLARLFSSQSYREKANKVLQGPT